MPKDETYHKSAIIYNELLAEAAENAVDEVEDAEVKKWCTAVGKQHRFHAKRHKAALKKLAEEDEGEVEVEHIDGGLDVPEEPTPGELRQSESRGGVNTFAPNVNYHDASTGQFVSEEFAQANPEKTVAITADEDRNTMTVQFSAPAAASNSMYYNAEGVAISKEEYEAENSVEETA